MHIRLESRRHRARRLTFRLLAVGVSTLCALSAADAQKAKGKSTPAKRPAVAASTPDGSRIFATTCVVCHQVDGAGKEGIYPPLAGSEWVMGDEAKLVRIILHGLTGPVEVAGETFSGAMPG